MGTVVVLGEKLVHELLPLARCLIVSRKDAPFSGCSTPAIYFATEEQLKQITGVKHPEPIAAEIDLPSFQTLPAKGRVLIMDKLQDPANLGMLIRSALAFGFEGGYLIEPVVDPFNDKAIRASKGAVFKLPLQKGTAANCLEWIQKQNITLYTAELGGTSINQAFLSSPPPLALVLGNESRGIDPLLSSHAKAVTIPISEQVDSLNVAVAGSLLMHEMEKQYGSR